MAYLVIPLIVSRGAEGFYWLNVLALISFSSLWIAVAIKITVNAIFGEDRPRPQLPKTYPGVKI
jgi:hypothetical protein